MNKFAWLFAGIVLGGLVTALSDENREETWTSRNGALLFEGF